MPTITERYEEEVEQLEVDSPLFHAFLHGPATGEGSTITTENGEVPTIAKCIADAQALIESEVGDLAGAVAAAEAAQAAAELARDLAIAAKDAAIVAQLAAAASAAAAAASQAAALASQNAASSSASGASTSASAAAASAAAALASQNAAAASSTAAGVSAAAALASQNAAAATAALIAAHSALAYAASVNIDFAGDWSKELDLTGNVTFTASNMAAGKAITVHIDSDASQRTLAFPAGWRWLNNSKPTVIEASKRAVLIVKSTGTTEAEVIASYSAEY